MSSTVKQEIMSSEFNLDSIEKFDSYTFEVNTPDGKLFVTVMERDGRIARIQSILGKSGSAVAAWLHSTVEMTNLLLEQGIALNALIEKLSETTSSRASNAGNGSLIRSGPDGLNYALMLYRKEKFKEFRESIGANDDDRTNGKGEGRLDRI